MTDEYPEPNDSTVPLAEMFTGGLITGTIATAAYLQEFGVLMVCVVCLTLLAMSRAFARGME